MRIRLTNVGVIDKCDVEFVPGINLIIGSSGSGKSTLMRSIHSMASNEFNDSDISFGKSRMNVAIDCNGEHVEYNRRIKSEKGERFYYTVNGETYTKVGRTALPQVADILKIGDLEVNGENINFNFNLQFSTPFLILGSQSTLYNVLTYRSSFDISSINDYYKADINNNSNEISTTVKLKERLDENLESLEVQAEQLSPVEKIYSDYMVCKHKSEQIDELNLLLEKIKLVHEYASKLEALNSSIEHSNSALVIISKLKEISKYNDICKARHSAKMSIENYNKLISNYEVSMNHIQSLIDINKLLSLFKSCKVATDNAKIINKCIKSSEFILSNEQLLNDAVRQHGLMSKFNRCSLVIKTFSSFNDSIITILDDLTIAKGKLESLVLINADICGIEKKEKSIHKQLSKFSVCPLCGGALHNG